MLLQHNSRDRIGGWSVVVSCRPPIRLENI